MESVFRLEIVLRFVYYCLVANAWGAETCGIVTSAPNLDWLEVYQTLEFTSEFRNDHVWYVGVVLSPRRGFQRYL